MPKKVAKDTATKSAVMEKLLASDDAAILPKVGDMIEGEVISLGKNEVILDLNGVTTGVVRGRELYDESGEYSKLSLGERVQALVVDIENERGLVELSFRIAGHQKAWDRLDELKKDGTAIPVEIIEANKGGLIVKLGEIFGFLPVSQLAPEHYPRVEGGSKQKILERLQEYIGSQFSVKIIDVNERDEKLIVSEKATVEAAHAQRLSGKSIGDEFEGRVTSVVDFGVFVEIEEGLEGLVHISELSWQRVDHPRDVVRVGETVKVKIIDIANGQVSLSMKRLQPDPWQTMATVFEVGKIISGKVVKFNPFGAFVEVEGGLQGLAHVSELKRGGEDGETLDLGKSYDFKIVAFEPERHKLGLSRKNM